MVSSQDRQFMLRAIKIAKRACGKTFPNPLVGAVVVKNGKIIGEGYHKKAGTPHAEIIALKKTKKNLENAHLYVSLEPCSHYGRTPPCVNTIIESGIKAVHIAMRDPNPLVKGKGLRLLRKHGIRVNVGMCRREAKELNPSYIKSMENKRVYGHN
jgi:diaminohydroxyphosphoribosylaminopyrimidine deaminase/5-amino-6-(5-phosphoribosylamino)uracil reductase